MLLVMLALSWHCHALWSAAPQLVHRGPSPSRRVPLSSASSRSWVRLQEERGQNRCIRRKLNPQYAFSPKVILSLRYVDSCRDHFLDLFYGLLHRVEVVGGDVRVQWLVLAGQGLPVLPRHL